VLLFFPDPWHKKRHHKRRIVQPEFLDLLAKKIKPGGLIHMATDWEDYAIHMMNVLTTHPDFANTQSNGNYADRPDYRPVTKFEQRGKNLGHGVWDLIFKRI
jgi:tRNA (guanine-N7-)-methyltransferase